ncbi:MAG: gas vesicle protein K [Planctomycetota bacterium]
MAECVSQQDLPTATSDTARPTPSVDINKDNVGKGLAQLVLTVLRLVHDLLERQAIRRMDAGSLTDDEVERLGTTLKAQADEIRDMAERFGLTEADLNLDLGPLGKAL